MIQMRYHIRKILRSRSAVFWSLLFPLFLGTLFYFMFGNIGTAEQFSEVPTGVVFPDSDPSGETFSGLLEGFAIGDEGSLSDFFSGISNEKGIGMSKKMFVDLLEGIEIENGQKLFDVKKYQTTEEADNALKNNEIEGYILLDDDYHLIVKNSGFKSSLIKTFIDQYIQNEELIQSAAMSHPEQIRNIISALFEDSEAVTEEIPLKGQDKSPYTQYFFALLAMTCLISSSLGLEDGMQLQADLSRVGARRNVAPMKKMMQVLSDFTASFLIYCILVSIVLAVCILVFKQDFGNNTFLILLATWTGSFVGLSAGMMIAVLGKGNEAKKQGLCVAFFMGSSFLGGLQWGDITYYLEKSCPFINRINPATLIVNAYKSLAVFGDTQQYTVNLLTLLGIGILFLGISILTLRRSKYASL